MKIDKSIKRVTVANTDIQRIMHGGGILWQRPFRWNVFNTKEVGENKYKFEQFSPGSYSFQYNDLTLYDDYKLNENTGVITGMGAKYLYNKSSGNGIWISGDKLYFVDCYRGTCRINSGYKVVQFAKKETVKGNFVKVITSPNLNDYPKNGINGEYWYELIEE